MDDNNTFHQFTSTNPGNPEDYGRKRAQILAAKAYLERLEIDNEVERAKYESDLLQKVREGEEARQRLQELQHYHNSKAMPLTIEAAPSTARIEEVPVSPPQPQTGQFTPALMHNQKSFQTSLSHPATQSTSHLPPAYNNLISQQPQRGEYYAGSTFRHYRPSAHNPAVPQSRSQQGPQPIFHHHQFPPANYKQQADNSQKSVQYQKPPIPRRTRSSSSQIPVQQQTQPNGVHSSVSQVQVNGVGNAYQDVQTPVHYNPTGVHPVGTSSLTGALGPQTTPSVHPSAPPPLATSMSSPSVPEDAPKHPRVNQVPASTQSTDIRSDPLSDSEMRDKKMKILAFRFSVLEWGKNSPPNTYTQFYNIKGKEFTEEQHSFFERLWVTTGLPLDAMPFKQGSPSPLAAAGQSVLSTAPRAIGTLAQTASTQGVGGHSASVSSTSHTHTPPKTSRQRTLVDPISGSWRSPADADKRRLARDVMHALGKRKQSFSRPSPNENPAKRQALEAPSTSGSVLRISEPVLTLPTLPVTSRQTEQSEGTSGPVQSEGTSEPVLPEGTSEPVQPEGTRKPVMDATNGMSPEPSVHTVEPPPTVVAPSVTPHSQSESSPLQDLGLGLPNPPESTLTPSSVQNGLPNGVPCQVAQQSGSLPPQGTTTTPSETHVHVTSPTIIRQERETPVKQSSIALSNVISHPGVSASSSSSFDEADSQPRNSTEMAAPPSGPSSIGQLNRSGQDTPSSLPILNDYSHWSELPQEASSSTVREPLFLPSPSPSSSSLPSKKNKRSSSVYVLVPPPPEYLIRYRKRQRMKNVLDFQKDDTRTSSLVSTFKSSRSLEAFSLPLERERDIPIDPHEQEAIRLSCSRLQPMPCRWGECDIILNSVDTLIHHLDREHKPTGISFICRWTQCGRHCRSHEKHLEKHAMMTLQCAYQGCKESYRASSQLFKHFRSKHPNGMLKVQAKPFRAPPQTPLPLPNAILPSCLIVTPPVTPTPISQEDHSILGPWVLRNVAGFDIERPRRARKASGYDSTEEPEEEEISNAYEFLNMRSTRYSWNQSEPVAMDFDDLDSEEISKECDQGLTFFGPNSEGTGVEDNPPSDEEASLFSSPPNINGDGNAETVRSERLDWQTTTSERSDEEDVVQRLLVD